jgi:hypothetical protein
MDARQTSLFPLDDAPSEIRKNPFENNLFSQDALFPERPRSAFWKQAAPTPETRDAMRGLISNPDPSVLGFRILQPAQNQTPALIQASNSSRPVAFLATGSMYINRYTILEFMDASYTDWGILTDGTAWSLFSRTVAAPAERCCTADLPGVLDAGDMELRRFLLLFSAAGHAAGAADRLLAQSRDARRRTASGAAQAAETALLALCRGFIRAEQAATGAAPAGPGLLMILRHALLLCERLLLLLYAETRGALPVSDARYERNSLCLWIESAASDAARHKPGSSPAFNLWPGLCDLFESAWRGDKATGAQPMACEFLDPAAHPFLAHNRVDDFHLRHATAALFEACLRNPARFADCDAADIAQALESLADARLALASQPMILAHDGNVQRWLPAKKAKWMLALERIGPGQAYLERGAQPAGGHTGVAPEAVTRTAVEALRNRPASVFDPACGTGPLLQRAAAVFAGRAAANDPSVSYMQHKRRVLETAIAGADVDAFRAEIARLGLTMSCLAPGLPPPVLAHRVRPGNALLALRPADRAAAVNAAEVADLLLDLGRAARSLPLLPDASFKDAKRRYEMSKRIAARTAALHAHADAARMQDPDCAASPLHPEIAFPGECGPEAVPAGFGALAAAAPVNPLRAAALLDIFAAPGATAALPIRESFLRTKKAAELAGADTADSGRRGLTILLIRK